ncbi:MAG TPA: hypothetical protein VFC64_08575 [Atopostipes sp.]|nr:hypothetical protein [Atopostipes sp.]
MNRTIKLQLLNLKKAYYYSAVTTYGVIILFWVIALLVDGPEFVSNMTAHPTWLSVLTFLLSPFTLMGFLYPVFDGLMFFDTALRFGVSRRNYFMGSVLIYVFLTIIDVFATGLSELSWTGSTPTYFAEIGEQYLSIGNLVWEFIPMLGLGLLMLAFYRFKGKAFIVVGLTVPILLFTPLVILRDASNSTVINFFLPVVELIAENSELFTGLFIAGMIGIYYLFISKTEVQD